MPLGAWFAPDRHAPGLCGLLRHRRRPALTAGPLLWFIFTDQVLTRSFKCRGVAGEADEIAMDVSVATLTPDRWPDIDDLFREGAVTRRCWCMYWRTGPQYRHQQASANKSAFRRLVGQGPPPGLLAYVEGRPVGWCQIGRRDVLPYMQRAWRLRSPDDVPVWVMSCFYIRKDFRRHGIAFRLTEAAIDLARTNGALAIEAYPVDRSISPSSSSTGFVTTFERLGFKRMPSPSRERPIMRLSL